RGARPHRLRGWRARSMGGGPALGVGHGTRRHPRQADAAGDQGVSTMSASTLPRRVLVQLVHGEQYGREICRALNVATGSLYPTVERLLDAGFITKRQEKDQPGLKRTLRTYYTITEAGRRYIADPDAVMPIGARDGDKLDDLRVVIGQPQLIRPPAASGPRRGRSGRSGDAGEDSQLPWLAGSDASRRVETVLVR